jgi:hypothetical protein
MYNNNDDYNSINDDDDDNIDDDDNDDDIDGDIGANSVEEDSGVPAGDLIDSLAASERKQKAKKTFAGSSGPGLPDFYWSKHTKMGKNIPNDHKLYQTIINYTKWP